MPMILRADTPGSAENALYMAQACASAYKPEAEGAAEFKDLLGLDARLISVDNTQVYVCENDQAIVLAFRGSEAPNTIDGFKDWLLTNANNYLILPEGEIGTDFAAAGVGARFHRGFIEALAMIWAPLFEATDQAQQKADRPLWITGHSLGGALALLASWRFLRNFVSVHEVITFGAPMIGNAEAAKAFETELAGKVFRYVNLEDPVPLLPTVSLMATLYSHCPNEVALSEAAEAASNALGQAKAEAAEVHDNATMMDAVWRLVKSNINAHFIEHYHERVKAKCEGSG